MEPNSHDSDKSQALELKGLIFCLDPAILLGAGLLWMNLFPLEAAHQ